MTDYLEEVLEEETEDREEFRPRRAVVMASRRERPESEAEEKVKKERGPAPGRLRRKRDLLPGEIGDGLKERKQEKERETDQDGEEETREKTAEVAESGDEIVPQELMPKGRTAFLPTEETDRRGEEDIVFQTETDAFSRGVISAEDETVVGEEFAEAERMALYAGTGDAFSAADRAGVLSAWGESGRNEAAGFLLRALGRAGRIAGTVRGGTGTAVVTIPGENVPGSEPDVEALDRLVRQDARRYDGGFQLF